ncbi:radical SAM/SPASM domain-containing protein [Candidatus Omnitrophota bacterium]
MRDFGIESHKLNFHPDRLQRWREGKDIYPIYMEISPTNSCNHRCIFCAFDYMEYKPVFIDKTVLKRFLADSAKRGVKSIMFGGEGEPLLHKDISEFILFAKEKGLDIAVTTNGIMMDKKLASLTLDKLSWIRFSLDGSTPKTYSSIHHCPKDDFQKAISNLDNLVKLKKRGRYKTTIGVQFLLLNQNYSEAVALAKLLKKIGVDYLIVKPYSKHPFSRNRLSLKLDYKKYSYLEKELNKVSGPKFQVIFRSHTMKKASEEKPYERCLGFSFWAYVSSRGELYACSCFLGDKRFRYGNLYKDNLSTIWRSSKRKKLLRMMEKNWDISNCRVNCRMDEINRYLWDLRYPPEHVNFI